MLYLKMDLGLIIFFRAYSQCIENSLMQSNFLGRDGFKWWVGQVAPEEAQGKQSNGDGWGNRVKV